MLSDKDLASLSTEGVKNITALIGNLSLAITINVLPPLNFPVFSVTLDAAPGYFVPQAGEEKHSTAVIQTKTPDGLVSQLPSPVCDGFDFTGWYKSNGSKVALPYQIVNDHTLTAGWVNSIKRTVHFVNNSVSGHDSTSTFPDGESFSFPQAPSIVGYNFSGWRFGTSPDAPIYLAGQTHIANANNMYFYAVYAPITFNINFNFNNTTITRIIGFRATLPSYDIPNLEATVVGKSHIWRDRRTKLTPVFSNIESDMEIDAEYSTNNYTLSFYLPLPGAVDLENLSIDSYMLQDQVTIPYNEHMPNPPSVAGYDAQAGRVGYSGAWRYHSQGRYSTVEEAQNVLSSGITSNYNFYARYTILKFKVAFTYGDGTDKITIHRNDVPYGEYIYPTSLPDIEAEFPAKYYTTTWKYFNTSYTQPIQITRDITFEATHSQNPFAVEMYYPEKTDNGVDIDYSDLSYLGISTNTTTIRYVTPGQTITNIPTFGNDPQYEIIGWKKYGSTLTLTLEQFAQTQIEDFCELENLGYYTAVVGIKKYTANFNKIQTVSIIDNTPTYVFVSSIVSIPYSTKIKFGASGTNETEMIPFDPAQNIPTYSDNSTSDFSFIGWHSSTDMSTRVVDFSSGYTVVDNSSFYTEWVDLAKGTEGLIFEAFGSGYELVGFSPSNSTVFETLVIPNLHLQKTVLSISGSAFSNAYTYTIDNLLFGKDLENIETGAFSGLPTLKSFGIINDEVSSHFLIDDGIIYKYINATELVILAYPASKGANNANGSHVISTQVGSLNVIGIADYAFAFARGLVEIAISDTNADSLVSIGNRAFFECFELVRLWISAYVEEIGEEAFAHSNFLNDVFIPTNSQIRSVGKNAFLDTPWLILQGEMVILDSVLLRYTGNAETLRVADNIKFISDGAFYPNGNVMNPLKTILFSTTSELLKIDSGAFSHTLVTRVIILKQSGLVEFATDSFGAQINGERTLEVYNSQTVLSYQSDSKVLDIFAIENIFAYSGD
jgi:uncharacterized repeat protein (TIGR02543 family)